MLKNVNLYLCDIQLCCTESKPRILAMNNGGKPMGNFHVPKSLCHVIFLMTSCPTWTQSTCISTPHAIDSRIFYVMTLILLSFVIILRRVCNLKKETADSSETPVTIRLQGIMPKKPLSPWRWQHQDSPKQW